MWGQDVGYFTIGCVFFDMVRLFKALFNHVTVLCVSVLHMRQGMANEAGLGEDQDTAVKNGDEVPEADVELSDDDPPSKICKYYKMYKIGIK